ncbi:MAG: alanine--tRNA ligase [Patescibacteria group bacterium]
MTASEIIQRYISFFEKRGHKRIPNASLVPENDPTTLFTSSGMQPLVPYLLGESHPSGKRLVNVQNSFRAQDIDEVGDNRHTTFFRMLGNWSLGDYFKKEQIPWIFEFVTKELGIPADKLYVTVFKGLPAGRQGYKNIPKDTESEKLWTDIFTKEGLNPKERIFFYGTKNWWSRSGEPDNMPAGEPGGPDSEIFYLFDTPHDKKYGEKCHPNCNCGRFLEIVNSVFMEYQKDKDGNFKKLPKQNVDHGAGVERLLAAVENKPDVFQTSLFSSIVRTIELLANKSYKEYSKNIRIITDHLVASVFIINSGVSPSNKEQGYILRRLIRRGLDNFYSLGGSDLPPVIESIVEQYGKTDPDLLSNFEKIKNTILQEKDTYEATLKRAKEYIFKKYQKVGAELKGEVEISAEDAFFLYSSHGLSPTQIKNLGLLFDEQAFVEKIKQHQIISRKGAAKKFKGGLADRQEKTIMGHTATHLLHQALRDVLGNHVFQSGSNITSERVRFDFSFERNLGHDEIKKVEDIVNKKIKEDLPVHFEMLPLKKAKELGAIGLFDEKYQDNVKVYFIGPSSGEAGSGRLSADKPYSIEFCGGPHVDFTSRLKRFKIIKQENLGRSQKRLYAIVGKQSNNKTIIVL